MKFAIRQARTRFLIYMPILAGLFFILLTISPNYGQSMSDVKPEVNVRKVTLETVDSLVIDAYVSKTRFSKSEEIVINYHVKNNGRRPVFLVLETEPKVSVNDDWVIQLEKPVRMPDPHDRFRYRLMRIDPRRSVKGKLMLDQRLFRSKKPYNFEIAEIQIGFSYVFDKSILGECKEPFSVSELTCLAELYKNSKSVILGNLVIETW